MVKLSLLLSFVFGLFFFFFFFFGWVRLHGVNPGYKSATFCSLLLLLLLHCGPFFPFFFDVCNAFLTQHTRQTDNRTHVIIISTLAVCVCVLSVMGWSRFWLVDWLTFPFNVRNKSLRHGIVCKGLTHRKMGKHWALGLRSRDPLPFHVCFQFTWPFHNVCARFVFHFHLLLRLKIHVKKSKWENNANASNEYFSFRFSTSKMTFFIDWRIGKNIMK